MQTTPIKVDDTQYEIPSPVAKRMSEYYNACTLATNAYNRLLEVSAKVRRLQVQYFSNKSPDILRACKAAEKELDALLTGKPPDKRAEQPQLFG